MINGKGIVYIALIAFLMQACKNDSARKQGKSIGGMQTFDEAIDKNPNDPELYFQRAMAYHQAKQDSLAIVDLNQAIKLDSTKTRYLSAAGDILFEAKQFEQSALFIEKALAINPNDARARLKLAKLFLYIKQHAKCFENLAVVLKADMYNTEAYFLKGMCYKDMGDTTKAINSFQTVAQIKANDVDALMQLALLHHKRDAKKAELYYRNAFMQDTMNVEPLNNLGFMYQELGKPEQAKAVWRECISHSINYAKAYYNIGCMLMDSDSTEKAKRHFDLAIRMDPSFTSSYVNRALCKETLGDKSGALEDFNIAIRLNPDDKLAQEGVARLK